MRAIVLSGGGSKGAYEIGVWKALRKLKINYDIVTGTSVGALNGVLMVQNDFHKALKIWKHINYDRIIDNSNLSGKKDFAKFYLKKFILHGGASVTRLEQLIDITVNEKKFFKSKINYGLITYNFSKLKPLELTKKKIKHGFLKKYIMASASCFPFFKKKEIDNESYIDGGFYDNLPINLAISLGATEVIAIDLKAIGIKQKVENDNIKIDYISPNNEIGNMLAFEKKLSRKNMKYGYNDTMKKYGKFEGNKYTFKIQELNKNYLKYRDKYNEILDFIFKDKRDFNGNSNVSLEKFNEIVENCGILFSVDESKIYKIKKYNKIINKKNNKLKNTITKKGINNILSIFDRKEIIKYIYTLMATDINANRKKIANYATLLNDEVLLAIYLYTIK